jgi:phenol hydroxylase P5 protein
MADYNAKITAIERLAPSVVQLTISLPSGFRFAPGQYVSAHLADDLARAYCIASAPERPQAVQLCIRLGSGRGSQALQALQLGDTLPIDGPFGEFLLPAEEQRDVLFIGGDTGIAPIRSIVLHMLATDDRRAITVLYEPDGSNILYARDFDPLAQGGRIVYESGDVAILIRRHHDELPSRLLMIAGFEPFLEKVKQALGRAGAAYDNAIVETFGHL